MFDDEIVFVVGRFVHSEVFEPFLSKQLPLRGSLQTERGGRTIPVIIFYQEDSSSLALFAGCSGSTVFGVWVIFIII